MPHHGKNKNPENGTGGRNLFHSASFLSKTLRGRENSKGSGMNRVYRSKIPDPFGFPAQNSPNAWPYFNNHALVQVDGVGLYDPSYGKSYLPAGNAAYNEATEEQTWQDAAISGFYYEYVVFNADGTLNSVKVGSAFAAHVAGHNDVPTAP